MLRIDLNRPVIIRYGALVVAQRRLGIPPEKVGFRIVGIKLNG